MGYRAVITNPKETLVDPVIVIASFTPKPGEGAAFIEVMAPMVEATRLEAGNETYDLYADDSGSVHLFERYTDSAALDVHRASDHYRNYRAGVADVLDGTVGVKVLSEHDVAS